MADSLDLDAIEARLKAATPGPWGWSAEDASMTSLTGPDELEQHVLSVTACAECTTREARCLGPREPDADLIAHAPTDLAALVAEVRRLQDDNTRLTDLVRYQRGDLHTASLITDAEYADLAGLTGSPARMEGYDALRGELERTKRARFDAERERDEARSRHRGPPRADAAPVRRDQFQPGERTMTQAETDILAERAKQRAKWGDDHDDEHTNPRALPLAAAYIATAALPGMPFAALNDAPEWVRNLHRDHGDRERLVIAAALLIAEIERIDRAGGR